MKLIVINGENEGQKVEINVDRNSKIKTIKENFTEAVKKKGKYIKDYFHFIYRNEILIDNQFIQYYKLSPNDEIWFGKIENYLNNDDIIVDILMLEPFAFTINLVMNKSDPISNIRSIVKDEYEIIKIWNLKGEIMNENKIVADIDGNKKCYKLLISYSLENSQIFDKCCELNDKFWINKYLFSTDNQKDMPFEDSDKQVVKAAINLKVKSLPDKILNQKLSDFPLGFVHSRLFCNDITARIFELVTNKRKSDKDPFIKNARIFKNIINVTIWSFLQSNQMDKSFRDILNSIIDFLKESSKDCLSLEIQKLQQNLIKPFPDIFDTLKFRYKTILYRANKRDNYFFIKETEMSVPKIKSIISLLTGFPQQNILYIKLQDKNNSNEDEMYNFQFSFEITLNEEDFTLGKEIGQGSFGKVYSCKYKYSQKEFALKVPKNPQNQDEIFILSQLRKSKNISSYLHLVCYKNKICVAMEIMPNGSLRSLLDKGETFSLDEISKFCYQILLQIRDLHKIKIIHGDIKCGNICLDLNNNAQLIDFGSSVYINTDDKEEIERLIDSKEHTIHFRAPELLLNGEIVPHSIDIWAFGITLIEIITGNPPDFHLSIPKFFSQMKKKKKLEFELPAAFNDQFKQFIYLCLHFNPYDRPGAVKLLQSDIFKANGSAKLINLSSSNRNRKNPQTKSKYSKSTLKSVKYIKYDKFQALPSSQIKDLFIRRPKTEISTRSKLTKRLVSC